MIPLHRLTHPDEPVYLNPDLIVMVEATPDTVVMMSNQSRVVVAESVDELCEVVIAWRAKILARALADGPPVGQARTLRVTRDI
ncbi:MAG TPA: flagellar FlbD family protein [Gaiellaceae bacterium]|jgi:flagellar protein FlbD|nr:flagellar FlbD family protein [Gaiellaceae bacterium]